MAGGVANVKNNRMKRKEDIESREWSLIIRWCEAGK